MIYILYPIKIKHPSVSQSSQSENARRRRRSADQRGRTGRGTATSRGGRRGRREIRDASEEKPDDRHRNSEVIDLEVGVVLTARTTRRLQFGYAERSASSAQGQRSIRDGFGILVDECAEDRGCDWGVGIQRRNWGSRLGFNKRWVAIWVRDWDGEREKG